MILILDMLFMYSLTRVCPKLESKRLPMSLQCLTMLPYRPVKRQLVQKTSLKTPDKCRKKPSRRQLMQEEGTEEEEGASRKRQSNASQCSKQISHVPDILPRPRQMALLGTDELLHPRVQGLQQALGIPLTPSAAINAHIVDVVALASLLGEAHAEAGRGIPPPLVVLIFVHAALELGKHDCADLLNLVVAHGVQPFALALALARRLLAGIGGGGEGGIQRHGERMLEIERGATVDEEVVVGVEDGEALVAGQAACAEEGGLEGRTALGRFVG